MKLEFICDKDFEKVSEAISAFKDSLSFSFIKKQIRLGELRVNGVKIKTDCGVKAGDNLRLFLPENAISSPDIKIVFENDEAIIAIKPTRVEVEPHLVAYLSASRSQIFAVHRLDRNTSGLVVLAKTEGAKGELESFFRQRLIDKYYIAEVFGEVKPKNGELELFIKKDTEQARVEVSKVKKPFFKDAKLEYRTIRKTKDTSTLEVKLITGRTHQIRASFAFVGNPVVGDTKYGKAKQGYPKMQRLVSSRIFFNFSQMETKHLKEIAGREFFIEVPIDA